MTIIRTDGTECMRAVLQNGWIPTANAIRWQSILTETTRTGGTEYMHAAQQNIWIPMGNVPASNIIE